MTSRADPEPQRLLAAHQVANEYYRSNLPREPRALTYLRSRGIVAATAHAAPWTIGYAPRGWTNLREHLRRAGFAEDELLAAGLVTTARNGNLIDVFRDRVTFPIRSSTGDIVAFTGRDLSGRPDTPKYRNTTTTTIYQKKNLLYGLAEQFDNDLQPAAVMLVEGPADVAAVARLRQSLADDVYPDPYYAVAPCGTALTAEQVALLAAAVPPGTPIVVAFDADTAGQAAIDKSYQLLRDWPGPVEAMALPTDSDPASLVANGPANAVASFHDLRTPLVDLVVEHQLTPHLARLDARLAELADIGRDPAAESMLIRLGAARAVAPLLTEIARADTSEAGRLSAMVAARLELNPLTMFETLYPPPADQADGPSSAEEVHAKVASSTPAPAGFPMTGSSPEVTTSGSSDAEPRTPATPHPARGAIVLGGPGFPDPEVVGHQYARACPPQAAAATWIEHDPATGHTAWVLAEGSDDMPADRNVARLVAEVAGRVAVLVGARQAIEIARTAAGAHSAQSGTTEQGNAAIVVLTSFDGDQPKSDTGRFTVAWAGGIRAYASTGRWFAPLTSGGSTTSVRGGPIEVNRVDLPAARILLAGRGLRHLDPARLREAIDGHRPTTAIDNLTRLGSAGTVALVIRPRSQPAVTPARLASQAHAATAAHHPRPLAGRQGQAALPAGVIKHPVGGLRRS